MRYIDNQQIIPLSGWETKARDALEDVANGICTVDDKSQIWRDIKGALAFLSHGKCWYCEAKQERSDGAVDHFRPRGALAKLKIILTTGG